MRRDREGAEVTRYLCLLLLAVAACAGDDPHELVTCETGWTEGPRDMGAPVTTCEAACAESPVFDETEFEMSCIWSKPPNGPPNYCPISRFREGGCCVPVPDGFDGERARIALIHCFD